MFRTNESVKREPGDSQWNIGTLKRRAAPHGLNASAKAVAMTKPRYITSYRTYKGFDIFFDDWARETKWSARRDDGTKLRADTLKGLRQLIRESGQ